MDFESLNALPHEKRDAIYCAAFACFGKTGYRKTSVADIAAAAGISKASVFYYFGTKREMYLYLLRFAVAALEDGIPEGTDDFFESLQVSSDAKMRTLSRYPGMADFLSTAYLETDDEIETDSREIIGGSIHRGMKKLFSKVDWSRLRDESERDAIIDMVVWVFDGYAKRALGNVPVEEIKRMGEYYLSVLKRAFYKEEYLT